MRLLVLLLFCFVILGCSAQTPSSGSAAQKAEAPAINTKLEAFQARTGSVIIKGFSNIGVINGRYGGKVTVQSMEFLDATTGSREYGVTIEVKETARLERDNTSYIDYDEIDSLLKGIDYITKVESSITQLASFQADYKTRGDFRISTFSSEQGVMAAVRSGRIGSTTAYLRIADLAAFRESIVKAKEKLDQIRVARK